MFLRFFVNSAVKFDAKFKFKLKLYSKFYLKIAPLKYEFTLFNQNLPRITRTALAQIAV